MRTTIDLPTDLHQHVKDVAHRTGASMSAVVVDLLRRGLAAPSGISISTNPVSGLPVVHLGRRITPEDVRAATDDEL